LFELFEKLDVLRLAVSIRKGSDYDAGGHVERRIQIGDSVAGAVVCLPLGNPLA